MDIKLELGKKIRLLREQKEMSREAFCDDELELTVRQLSRIESGESLPTLPKLTYISQRLFVPISHLIDESQMTLPKRYLELKMSLFRRPPQYNKEMEDKVESIFNEIYEQFYDILPEEEQLLVDVDQAIIDVHHSEKIDFGEGILSDYFFQVKNKTKYTDNDLIIANLYFHCSRYSDVDSKEFEQLVEKCLDQVNYASDVGVLILGQILIIVMGVYISIDEYVKVMNVIKIFNTIMKSTQDFHKKPIVDMLEGKCWLQKGEIEKAKQKYQDASLLARLHQEELLSKKIEEEWKADLKESIFED
ncbi:helix-turn-helix domain-containing protein [Enterococcus plantarum]|uniref:helix-turn-helix domain-containing protein n=1 Tax=Enterococcus plantarum TaxID=1077675 RepID=UPI001A8C5EDF|nr:XRE family transcriptional regulator [Enterococcus plantarum]MBO0468603.1 helix-turn-helix domain-containing protein [Enterococcus plantarum]